MDYTTFISQSRAGHVAAYARLVEATQGMVYAVAYRVLKNHAWAQDAAQEVFLRAYRRLNELQDSATFPAWLRRIAVTVALDLKRRERLTFVTDADLADIPVLDESEATWSDAQRRALAKALLGLSTAERRICDRHYHGGWSVARLAEDAGIREPAMRKRLQRIRDHLREEMEMSEQRELDGHRLPSNLPDKIAELLAKPTLVDLPENPVGKISEILRGVFAGYPMVDVPEVVDLPAAKQLLGQDPVYIDEQTLHTVEGAKILRYDLTLPILMSVRYEGQPIHLVAAGKVYRKEAVDATHLEAFHQFEAFVLEEAARMSSWTFAGLMLQSLHAVLPKRAVRLVPTHYPICSEAWQVDVEADGAWVELAAWGVYNAEVLRYLGADPNRHAGFGIGYGLERIAGLRYHIDDIRKMEAASV